MTMRHYGLVGRQSLRLDSSAPVPMCGPSDVLVRVGACTVCNRSDLAYYHYYGLRDHCSTGTFGHEVAGTIERVGDSVSRLRPGDRVFVRRPKTSGFADFAVANETAVGLLPDDIPFEQGAILQTLPLAIHATRGVRLGDRVAIVGQGPIGLMALQVVRLRGASHVTVADLDEWRLSRARSLGADASIHADPALPHFELGDGYDVAIDAVGTPETIQACVAAVRHNGLVVFLGSHHIDTHVTFDLVQWELKSLRVHSSVEPDDAARRASVAVAERLVRRPGAIRLSELLTHVFPLHELPRAIDLLSPSRVLAPTSAAVQDAQVPEQTLKVAICP